MPALRPPTLSQVHSFVPASLLSSWADAAQPSLATVLPPKAPLTYAWPVTVTTILSTLPAHEATVSSKVSSHLAPTGLPLSSTVAESNGSAANALTASVETATVAAATLAKTLENFMSLSSIYFLA